MEGRDDREGLVARPLKPSERIAHHILSTLRPGVDVRYIKEQHSRHCDFELLDLAGVVFGVVEVTMAADQRMIEMYAQIAGRRSGGTPLTAAK